MHQFFRGLSFVRRLYWIAACIIILFGTYCWVELPRDGTVGAPFFGMTMVIIASGVILAMIGMLAKLIWLLVSRAMTTRQPA